MTPRLLEIIDCWRRHGERIVPAAEELGSTPENVRRMLREAGLVRPLARRGKIERRWSKLKR